MNHSKFHKFMKNHWGVPPNNNKLYMTHVWNELHESIAIYLHQFGRMYMKQKFPVHLKFVYRKTCLHGTIR